MAFCQSFKKNAALPVQKEENHTSICKLDKYMMLGFVPYLRYHLSDISLISYIYPCV